jgi:hypothetical protein
MYCKNYQNDTNYSTNFPTTRHNGISPFHRLNGLNGLNRLNSLNRVGTGNQHNKPTHAMMYTITSTPK